MPAVLKWYDTRPRKEERLYKIKQFYIHMARNEAEVTSLHYADGHHYAGCKNGHILLSLSE
jgi:hypothetical protein